jgi:hypothetical protein
VIGRDRYEIGFNAPNSLFDKYVPRFDAIMDSFKITRNAVDDDAGTILRDTAGLDPNGVYSYCLYDMDNDGTAELIVQTIDYMGEEIISVYKIVSDSLVNCGTITTVNNDYANTDLYTQVRVKS